MMCLYNVVFVCHGWQPPIPTKETRQRQKRLFCPSCGRSNHTVSEHGYDFFCVFICSSLVLEDALLSHQSTHLIRNYAKESTRVFQMSIAPQFGRIFRLECFMQCCKRMKMTSNMESISRFRTLTSRIW